MILPTKHLNVDRSLLFIGAEILEIVQQPAAVSYAWDSYKKRQSGSWRGGSSVTFDWFLLALAFLFTVGAIELEDGRLRRRS